MSVIAYDGTAAPILTVEASFGTALAAAPDPLALKLGGSVGLGTGRLGGITWVDITADVRTLTWNRGRDDNIGHAATGLLSVELDNTSGAYDPANLSGPYVVGGVSTVDAGVSVRVRASYGGVLYERFTGDITSVDLDYGYEPVAILQCSDALEWLGRTFIPPTTDLTGDLDFTGARIGRVLDEAGWPDSQRALDTGATRLGPPVYGDFALSILQQIESTELGLLFVDGAGKVTFYDRHRTGTNTRSTTVQASFSDSDTSKVEYLELKGSKSRVRVYNVAHVTRNTYGDGDAPVEQIASDATSVAKYGSLSYPDQVGTLVIDDNEALALAQFVVAQFKNPTLLFTSLTADGITQAARWATLLALQLFDRVSVARNYGPNTVTTQLLIEGIRETITPGDRWTIQFSTAPTQTTGTLWKLGTAQLGVTALGY